ncbi:MAG: hypothetical protein OXN90_05130, partial [Gemmatimonadota bacterium]|nr:hypothetical protein [Gemmatimonadota bacterium]
GQAAAKRKPPPRLAGTLTSGLAVRKQCGADSVPEVLPVPVGRVGPGVGLAWRQDEKMGDFNELQDMQTPTPEALRRAKAVFGLP